MIRKLRWHLPLVPFLLLAAVMASGCADKQPTTGRKATDVVPVKTVAAVAQEVHRRTTQPATVHPFYRAELQAMVSGYVDVVRADIGDFVEAGATLAVIAVPEIRKQREVIESRIVRYQSDETRAVAGVQLAEANVRAAEARLSQAGFQLNRAEASLAAMEAEFNRTQDLVDRQSLERRVLDEVRKKRDSEIANKEAAASGVDFAQANITVAEAQLAAAQADVKAAEAETSVARRQRDEIDVMIDYATLRAPFAGLVTQRDVDPGDLVRATSESGSRPPLFVVSQVETVRVHVPVPETTAAFVRRGDTITFRFPSFSAEEPITAQITRFAGDLDPSTRTMLVEAEVSNPELKLIPGMFGEATIDLSTKVAATMLPARAIRYEESGQAYVYVVENDSTVSIASVKTGLDDGHSIQIVTGLQPGQQVIDAHLKRFRDGQKVAPLNH